MKKFYIVLTKRPTGEYLTSTASPREYTQEQAISHAREYAAKNIGYEYVVMQAYLSCKTSEPVVIGTVFE